MEHYAATDELLRTEFRVSARAFRGDAVCELEPALKPGLGGGWLYETDAHLRPDRLMQSWRMMLEARGIAVRDNSEVRGFVHDGGRASAVSTASGDVAADAFVVAAGALDAFCHSPPRLPDSNSTGQRVLSHHVAAQPVSGVADDL